MAVTYWENMLRDLKLPKDYREEIDTTYIHTLTFSKRWTRKAIKLGIEELNKTKRSQNEEEISLTDYQINEAAKVFHDTVNSYAGKKADAYNIQPALGPGFEKLKMAPLGSKKGLPGQIFKVIDKGDIQEVTANKKSALDKVMVEAKKQTKKHLEKKFGEGLKKLSLQQMHFAHGEAGPGTPATTASGLAIGQEALTKANSKAGEQALLKQFKKDNVDLNNINLIKELGVASLRDYMREELYISIKINEKETGDAATFEDEFIVHGAAKVQDPTFARSYDKRKGGGIQARYLNAVRKALRKRWAEGDIKEGEYRSSPKGSKRQKNIIKKVVTKNFKKHAKNFNVDTKLDPLLNVSKKTKIISTAPKRKGKRILAKGKQASITTSKARKDAEKIAGVNPMALKELIQAALPEEILERMNFPALVNRTGRFRKSATITNVMVGPRGGTEVEYTYMRNPYQTFEPGGKQGGTYRDPRKIIGASIREIATKLTGNKFIRTRRV